MRLRFSLKGAVVNRKFFGLSISFSSLPYSSFTDTSGTRIDLSQFKFKWPERLKYTLYVPLDYRATHVIPKLCDSYLFNRDPDRRHYRRYHFDINPRKTDFFIELSKEKIHINREYILILLSTLLGIGIGLFVKLIVTVLRELGTDRKINDHRFSRHLKNHNILNESSPNCF